MQAVEDKAKVGAAHNKKNEGGVKKLQGYKQVYAGNTNQ